MPDRYMLDLDHFDLALLDVLQRFGRATHQQLAEQVPLSPSQIGRRLQRLEQIGVVDVYRVVLRPEKLGLGVTAFTSLPTRSPCLVWTTWTAVLSGMMRQTEWRA